MAKVKITTNAGFSIDQFDFSDLFDADEYSASSSYFRATYSDGSADIFRGKGFKYDDGVPTGGTITSYTSVQQGEKIGSITDGSAKVTAVVKAARTFSTADDLKVFKGVLAKGDKFEGGGGSDIFNTYGGNDTLNGRGGSDVLTGGGGKDSFVFSTALGFSNVDRITDFNHKADTFKLWHGIFKGIGEGKVSSREFKEVTDPFASTKIDKSDRIIYDRKDGDLFFDRDGSGAKYDPVKFAEVKDKLTLDHTDFLIV